MSPIAVQFGSDLRDAFRVESSTAPFSEVKQFRALMNSFAALAPRFFIEEYHGPKHQVFFNGTGAWGRTPARCELCDVVFIAYSPPPDLEIRVTFLQAKLSREKHTSLCGNYPLANDAVDFEANLEQWDLLSRRPTILPVPPFKVHPLLLQDATLPSVGSFGVFHRSKGKNIEFFYSSADHLTVVGTPGSKNGRLATDGVSAPKRHVSGYLETTFSCCLPTFGKALYSLEIGTPVELGVAKPHLPQSPLASWLRDLLQAYLRQGNPNSRLARELLVNMGVPDEPPPEEPMALPAMVLVRGSRAGRSFA
jgi:hypothetical protein